MSKKYTADDIYAVAKSYRNAGRAIQKHIMEINSMSPTIVNYTFSLELFFKCLYFMEYNKPYKAPHPRDGHSLYKLYNSLTQESKKLIKVEFDKKINWTVPMTQIIESKILPQEISDILKRQSPNFPNDRDKDILSVLRECDQAFSQWRYPYEGNQKPIQGTVELIEATKLRIDYLKKEENQET